MEVYMDEKDVIISIKGIQNADDINDVIELVTDGVYSFTDDACEFAYMESELTGLEGTKTTFRAEGGLITLTREGSVNSQMIFQKGKKHVFMYETPYGAATMGVDTREVKLGLNEHGGNIELSYAVDMDNIKLGENTFRINIRGA
jgi:uncharacterized beta-barrel protein YwiB (DUF1934 family)